jgi:hypothetical protein
MISLGSGDSIGEAAPSFGVGPDVTRRLSRSATIALLASPAGLLLISIVRLLIVSDYSPVTASAIVSAGGYVDALLGTLIPLVPIFMPYLALLLLFVNRVILGSIALLATLVISPAAVSQAGALAYLRASWGKIEHAQPIAATAMVVLAILVAGLLVATVWVFRDFARTIAVMAAILLVPVMLRVYPFPFGHDYYTQLIRQPWLPAERITLDSGQNVIGYVLADSPSWLVVLRDSNRRIYYYPAQKVAALSVCQIGVAPPTRPLVTLITTSGGSAPAEPCQAPAGVARPAGDVTSRSDRP